MSDVQIGSYCCRSFAFSIRTDVAEAAGPLAMAFGDLTSEASDGGPETSFELIEGEGGVELIIDGQPGARFTGVAGGVDHLVAVVNQRVLDASSATLNLHAAALVDGENRTLLVPGVSGAGKTTLCGALVRAGLAYMSDEMIGIDPADLTLIGYPKALTVKAGSRALLGADLDFGTFSVGDEAQTRWYVPVGALGDGGVRSTAAAHAVVFARRVDGARPSLDTVSRAESAVRLLLNTFDLGRFGPEGLELVARLVSTCRCAVATYDDVDAILPLVTDLLATAVDPAEFVLVAASEPSGRPIVGPINAASSPEPRRGVVAVLLEDGGVVYEPAEGRTLLLDRIGAAVWPMLDGRTMLADLADELTAHFDADADEVRHDLVSLCRELAASGFVSGIEPSIEPPHWRTALAALDERGP